MDDTDDPCTVGTNTDYVITARNEGTAANTNVAIINDLPVQMKLINVKAQNSKYQYDRKNHRIYFEPVAILQPGDKIVHRIKCKVVLEGRCKNIVRLKYDQLKREIFAEEQTLSFNKNIDFMVHPNSTSSSVKQTTSFLLTIKNKSAKPIVNAQLLYRIPKELQYVFSEPQGTYVISKFSNTVTWKFDIPRKATRQIKVQVLALSDTSRKINSTTNNRFHLSGLEIDREVITSLKIKPEVSKNVVVTTYDLSERCAVGEKTTYITSVYNKSRSAITNIKLQNDIPSRMQYIHSNFYDASGDKIKYQYNEKKRRIYFDAIDSLQVGEEVIFHVTCQATGAGITTNTVHLTYDGINKEIISQQETIVHDD
ncbi:hypothetical protein [Candidatus Uabimicrobium sp. HlEnr_7]|uniref:hypothetical protein n=1 Tax=Candidatus Uabimicrobium helgolandensis TaxID=3095367 RepID=UPI003557CD14